MQQQCEVHTDVRVTIDALDYEYNHDARTQSPRPAAARRQLAVDRRGLGSGEQEEQRTQRASSVFNVSYASTHRAAALIVLGSDALLKRIPREAPRHVSSRRD